MVSTVRFFVLFCKCEIFHNKVFKKFKVQNPTGPCKCGTKVYLPVLFPVTSLNVYYLKQGTVWPARSLLANPSTDSQKYAGSLFN